MRIAVFGPLLALYSYWIWMIVQTVFNALFTAEHRLFQRMRMSISGFICTSTPL